MTISRSGIDIMNARTRNVSIARETIDIIKSGIYKSSSGAEVNISADIKAAVENSVIHETPIEGNTKRTPIAPAIEVINETTTSAARRLLSSGKTNLVALNFAAALNVGGGFLGGANAQEEALCRASGLYECIRRKPMFYNKNIINDSPFYTDTIIYSPDVPFFRNDAHEFLEEPYKLSIITSPAPNVSSLGNVNETELASILMNRASKILKVAEMHGHKNIILGAWGCGAFGNDPRVVASVFRAALEQVPAFESVCFAVYDTREPPVVYEAFREVFASTNDLLKE
jgi:uncharacterized protein (TIGR02452 family)